MTTYTIAMLDDVLIATVQDSKDIMLEASNELVTGDYRKPDGYSYLMSDLTIISGLTLSNDEPADADIIYSGTTNGWLQDENGNTYLYAYKA